MSMTRRAPGRSATISEVGAIGVSPENATCSLMSERATTHPLERPPVWPVLGRPRLAGFEVSTEDAMRLARVVPQLTFPQTTGRRCLDIRSLIRVSALVGVPQPSPGRSLL